MSTRTLVKPKPQPADPFHIGYRLIRRGEETIQVPLTEADFLHPQEEDRFLITDDHANAMICIKQAIEVANREQSGVRVFCDHRTDWQAGNVLPMGPDVVAFGDFHVEWAGNVGTLTVEDLGVTKLLAVEITSPSTRHVDMGEKPPLYHRVGVPYLLIVDLCPPGGAEPQILGFRATRKEFVPLKENAEYGIWIPTVQMWFKLEGSRVVAHTAAKERILENRELVQKLDEKTARVDELEQELAELLAKIANPSPKKNGNSNGR